MDPIDYDKVIADLEGRRAAFNASIDAAIQAIKSVLAAGPGQGPAAYAVRSSEPNGGALTPDMLFGKSIPEAAIVCLQERGLDGWRR